MANKNDSWGIEVGANAIKALHLIREGDDLVVADYEVLPFKKILTTPDLNVDEAVQVGLDQLMSRYDMKKSSLVVSVPGHMAFARFAKLPPVEPKKVAEIVKFEAHQQIPFPLEQVEWDYQVFQQEDSPEVEVGIFAISKDRVSKFMSDYQQVGLRIDALTLSPLGVYNAMAYDMDLQEDSPGSIFVDIGTSSTDVIIVEAGGIWLRTLPIGGNNFTEALVKAFKLTFPKAEKLKREAGTSKYARQIFQAMRPVFADLVQEIQRSLGYYQSLNRDADLKRLVGVGSTFRLPGLTKFLKQQLQIDVKRLDGFKRLQIDGKREAEFTSNALNLSTVYGLALQGLELDRVSANVLPKQIMFERMWKAKQPKFAVAAGIVVAAVVAAQVSLMTQRSGFDASKQQYDPTTTRVISSAQQMVSEWQEIAAGKDPRNRLENFRRIPDYRNLWPSMLEDLNAATAALDAQSELLTPDYEAIQAIPREERRFMYIESYDVVYWPDGKNPASEQGRRPAAPGLDDMNTMEAEKPMPRYEVTLIGTTPNRGASGFLNTFLDELRKQQVDRNRPYKIINSNVVLNDLKAIERDAPEEEATPGRRPMPSRGPVRRGGAIDPMMMDEFAMMPGGPGIRGRGRGGARSGEQVPQAELLPENPLKAETGVDYRFEIRWVVETLPPEDARLREDPSWRPEPPQAEASPEGEFLDEGVDTPPEPQARLDTPSHDAPRHDAPQGELSRQNPTARNDAEDQI